MQRKSSVLITLKATLVFTMTLLESIVTASSWLDYAKYDPIHRQMEPVVGTTTVRPTVLRFGGRRDSVLRPNPYYVPRLSVRQRLGDSGSSASGSDNEFVQTPNSTASPQNVLLEELRLLEPYGSCSSTRFKRDSSSELIDDNDPLDILYMDVHQILRMEYDKRTENMTFGKFMKQQLSNPVSAASTILKQGCDELHSKNYYNANNDEVHFSLNKFQMSGCIKHHKLFHCYNSYESTGIVKEVAELAAKNLSRKTKTRQKVADIAESLVYDLMPFYPELPVDYVIEALKQAVLYCSDKKIKSTIECSANNVQFLGLLTLAWFDLPSGCKKSVRFHDEELVFN